MVHSQKADVRLTARLH